MSGQGGLFDTPAAVDGRQSTVDGVLRADLRHKICGQVAVVERPHMNVAGKTELFCTVCHWIILDLHVEKACESSC